MIKQLSPAKLLLLTGALGCACVAHAETPEKLQALSKLSRSSAAGSEYVEGEASKNIDQMRYKAMIEAAQVLGLQEGVKYRQEQINKELASIKDHLEKIYNFSALMLNDGVMIPPVIDEVLGAKKIESDGSINASERTYVIREKAKLTIDPPSWRDYLIHHYSVTDKINKAILPKNDKEQAIWKKTLQASWKNGMAQANYMYGINLSRLNRDYLGMARFKSLAKQRIVEIPMLARGDLGIRVNGKKLDIGQNTFRITNHSTFRSGDWDAAGYVTNEVIPWK